ncbi:MAG: hypothetical protein ACFB3T_04890 [Geminicoccaceae bacterium]
MPSLRPVIAGAGLCLLAGCFGSVGIGTSGGGVSVGASTGTTGGVSVGVGGGRGGVSGGVAVDGAGGGAVGTGSVSAGGVTYATGGTPAVGPVSGDPQALAANWIQDNGNEENGRCSDLIIESVTRFDVVEETDERLVANVRYFYRDYSRDERNRAMPFGQNCKGFNARTMEFAKVEGGYQIVSATGEQKKLWKRKWRETA